MATEVVPPLTGRPVSGGTTDRAPVRRAEVVVVAGVTAAFGLILLLWAVLVPAFQAPDERAHFDAAVHVALGDGWPAPGDLHLLSAIEQLAPTDRTPLGDLLRTTDGADSDTVNQMTQHPPTYYVVAAGLLHLTHFEDRSVDAAVAVLRLIGALAVLPLPALAWATVRRVTRSARAGVVGAFAVLAVPELASIGASVSNDGPVMLFAGTTVWLASRVLTGDRRTRTAVALGVSLGVALLWKGTALPLIPFVGLAVVVGATGRPFPVRVLRAVWVLAVAAALGAWWWVRNLLVHHQLQPDGFSAIRPPRPFPADTGPDPVTFVGVSWSTIARTFWGSFGGKAQWIVSPVLFETATVLALGAVLIWGFRRGRGSGTALTLAVLPVTILLLQSWTTWSSYLDTTFVGGTQGRYYFPAVLAFIALSAIAWRRALRTETGHRRAGVIVPVVAAVIALYGPLYLYGSVAEHGRVRVTARGLDLLATTSPVPVLVSVVLWCAALVVLVVALVGTARLARRSSADRPSGGEPSGDEPPADASTDDRTAVERSPVGPPSGLLSSTGGTPTATPAPDEEAAR
ncbi:glycosyltransferase family 39 protein [Curtobacterium sp. MCBD17_021]|uniref:glycosyltransferase family 39 protein n=1 Tax=Curtobacterium sp. MCBD17_021 TaxID=2175665 RepID=UPI000DA9938B|nr:glycosyltransferase family 39 protein [Curtobacterium sp. MCBD17_021]PZE68094.1 hypothetical protein DEI83_03990 [Curtobacterium sp. MCBD17_021]